MKAQDSVIGWAERTEGIARSILLSTLWCVMQLAIQFALIGGIYFTLDAANQLGHFHFYSDNIFGAAPALGIVPSLISARNAIARFPNRKERMT